MNPGVPANTLTVYQTEPSLGCGITAYGPEPATRMSLPASAGLPGSVYSPTLPSPLVSRIHGAQPCAFTASPVSSHVFRLIHPATGPDPDSHSVLSAS